MAVSPLCDVPTLRENTRPWTNLMLFLLIVCFAGVDKEGQNHPSEPRVARPISH